MAMMKAMSMTILTMKICDTALKLTHRVSKTKRACSNLSVKRYCELILSTFKPVPFPDIQKVSNQEEQSEK